MRLVCPLSKEQTQILTHLIPRAKALLQAKRAAYCTQPPPGLQQASTPLAHLISGYHEKQSRLVLVQILISADVTEASCNRCKRGRSEHSRRGKHWNFTMMAIRSPRISASSIECVVSTMARPGLAASMMSHVARLLIGSRPVVGSSKNTIFGSPECV